MQCIESKWSSHSTNFWPCDVCSWPKWMRLHAVGLGPDGAVKMDLLVVIAQVVKDLLGNLNPFKLLNKSYRARMRDLWRQESAISKIGYVLGMLFFLTLLTVGVLLIFKTTQQT